MFDLLKLGQQAMLSSFTSRMNFEFVCLTGDLDFNKNILDSRWMMGGAENSQK